MKRYYIGQLGNSDYKFMSWNFAKDKFNLRDYVMVWTDVIEKDDDINILNVLYEKFNINHPEHYAGHSMSVSDIVMIYDDEGYGERTTYYVDSFGFEKIEM